MSSLNPAKKPTVDENGKCVRSDKVTKKGSLVSPSSQQIKKRSRHCAFRDKL